MDAYLNISNALLAGLQRLGVTAEKAPASVRAGSDVSAACFEVPSAYEITAGGRKLMGSAQSRRAGYVLQHGSLPLVGRHHPADRRAGARTLPPPSPCAPTWTPAPARWPRRLDVPEDSPEVQFAAVCAAMRQGFEADAGADLQACPTCRPANCAAPPS